MRHPLYIFQFLYYIININSLCFYDVGYGKPKYVHIELIQLFEFSKDMVTFKPKSLEITYKITRMWDNNFWTNNNSTAFYVLPHSLWQKDMFP